jgi:hypothetical protein
MTAALTPARTNNAIYECCAANDRWPTLVELASTLDVTLVEAHHSLTELIAKRMVRERFLDGRRVWVPWNEG